MTDLSYTPDVPSPAWDVFVSSLDLVEIEGERMRSGDLKAERFGSREHHEMLWLHEVRRGESLKVRAAVVAPVWFAEWQLQVAARVADAECAANGAVVASDGFSVLAGSGGRSEAIGVLEDEREKAA